MAGFMFAFFGLNPCQLFPLQVSCKKKSKNRWVCVVSLVSLVSLVSVRLLWLREKKSAVSFLTVCACRNVSAQLLQSTIQMLLSP